MPATSVQSLGQLNLMSELSNKDQELFHDIEQGLAEAYVETEAVNKKKTNKSKGNKQAINKIDALKKKLGQLD